MIFVVRIEPYYRPGNQTIGQVRRQHISTKEYLRDCFERHRLGHIVHDQHAHRVLVVDPGHGPEAILPGDVPELELDGLIPHGQVLDMKVDPDGGFVFGDEHVCDVSGVV